MWRKRKREEAEWSEATCHFHHMCVCEGGGCKIEELDRSKVDSVRFSFVCFLSSTEMLPRWVTEL